ncbi:hypothetical protein SEA_TROGGLEHUMPER_39 [Rhodococcus phage Trogglehumper]|uniref:Uncharacterized protein n=1 Tax=Rhodococcus phage Trogglehumper TaxID=3038381 RepID=A0AAF0K1Y8_9CAUD|nr:hypothetical protein SEA_TROGGLEHUMPER_39 [Rhodococcus phage Trogglehumper]
MSHLFSPSAAHFPYNALFSIEEALQELAPHTDPVRKDGVRIYRRPLNGHDEGDSIGIIPVMWNPDPDSVETGRDTGATVATFQRYPFDIQTLVTDPDEIEGIKAHSYFAALVKQTLQFSEILNADLKGMSANLNGSIEVVNGWGVENQTYFSEGSGSFFSFMSRTSFYVDTEIK